MKKLSSLLFLFIPITSFADGIAIGKIKGYAINTGAVYVSSESTISNTPTCNVTNRFYFTLDSSHSNSFLSAILKAHATGEELSLTGTGACDGGNSETLRKICTLNIPC